ncbi:MAG TPA: glycosyltransferase [Dermatophilaceae bacterium]|nr:glycosyltransferase [Dermatophilaceae bacterium]
MKEVEIGPIPLDRLAALLSPERAERLLTEAGAVQKVMDGRTLWCVNATATGGGVAEMLLALLAYAHGAGIESRWLVLDGDPEFFSITKRIHNHLHGSLGDGGPLGPAQQAHFTEVLQRNAELLRKYIKPGDAVLLHDPQTAGLVDTVLDAEAFAVWRCHVGRDEQDEVTDLAWDFLRPHLERTQAFVFSREGYAPSWVPQDRLMLIPPSLDPFTAKNAELSPADVDAALLRAGLVETPPDSGSLTFIRRDGSSGEVRPHQGLIQTGGKVPVGARYVMQVSRWDRLKDMPGVLKAFTDAIDAMPPDVHVLLVGPDTDGVTDDPEGAEVLAECMELWRTLPDEVRRRSHLVCLPMDDTDENAHLVNALQRRASVVVQKSIVEGFGLTVTEPMWKGRPVVASAVGGINDQIVHGESGLLVQDPHDLSTFAGLIADVLSDEEYARTLGTGARARVRDLFLGDRHLVQWAEVLQRLKDL